MIERPATNSWRRFLADRSSDQLDTFQKFKYIVAWLPAKAAKAAAALLGYCLPLYTLSSSLPIAWRGRRLTAS